MGYAIYMADWKAIRVEPPNGTWPSEPAQWEDLTEEEQATYIRHAEAVLAHLLEHGRIISYVTAEMYRDMEDQYVAYVAEKVRQARKRIK